MSYLKAHYLMRFYKYLHQEEIFNLLSKSFDALFSKFWSIFPFLKDSRLNNDTTMFQKYLIRNFCSSIIHHCLCVYSDTWYWYNVNEYFMERRFRAMNKPMISTSVILPFMRVNWDACKKYKTLIYLIKEPWSIISLLYKYDDHFRYTINYINGNLFKRMNI